MYLILCSTRSQNFIKNKRNFNFFILNFSFFVMNSYERISKFQNNFADMIIFQYLINYNVEIII